MDTILCDELLQEIFHHLPPSTTTITTVSKRWLHLFRSSLTSLTLHLPNTSNHHNLTSFLSQHTFLTSLTINTTTSLPITSISRACPFLTRLSISPTPISSPHLLLLSSSCPLLTSLSLVLSRPLFPLHVFSSFNKLHTLTLTVTGKCYTSSESTLATSPLPLRLNLNSLTLNGISSSDYQLTYLWNNVSYKNLTTLVFEKCEGLADVYSFSRFLKALVNLSELELKTCRSIVGLVLFKLSEMSCEKLSSLLIYDGGNKEGLLSFIRETRCDLRELHLRLPLDLGDVHLSEIGVKFRKLRVLRLQSCSMVTGEGLKGLGLALSDHLEELSLTNCDVIKRQSGVLVDLAQSLRKIKVLDLSYNHMLVDKEFVSMISSHGDLRELKVRGCGRLTDVSLIALCRSCKRLERLDMVFCHGIRVEGVEFIILNCKELRKVQVEDHKLSEDARKWMVNKFIEVQP